MARVYKVRPGPKFELTQDMVIQNIQTVVARIGCTQISRNLYDRHGSFCIRTIERKWGWKTICGLAGVQCGVRGSRKLEWHLCPQCERHLASSRFRYCGGCRKTMRNRSGGDV